jgi:transposase-like protein
MTVLAPVQETVRWRVEVITGPERRRRWSDEEKRAIVAASLEPGAVVADVARRAEVVPGQIYRWRQELQAAANGFAHVDRTARGHVAQSLKWRGVRRAGDRG